MINGIIGACFAQHFPETSGFWKGQKEKVSFFKINLEFFVIGHV